MVKPQELRIGNWVLANGKVTEVESVSEFGINTQIYLGAPGEGGSFEYDFRFDRDKIEGILITEELLLRFGFRKSENRFFLHVGKKSYFTYIEFDAYDNIGKFSYCHDDERGCYQPIEYVHQLQNLFYWLSGEELTIKENV